LVVEVLYVERCPCVPAALSLVQRMCAELGIDAEIRTILVTDQAAAERARFPGSPTVRVAGRDVEPGAEPLAEYTLECRLYRHEHRLAGYPPERWVCDAPGTSGRPDLNRASPTPWTAGNDPAVEA
jgi:hypothetical protein